MKTRWYCACASSKLLRNDRPKKPTKPNRILYATKLIWKMFYLCEPKSSSFLLSVAACKSNPCIQMKMNKWKHANRINLDWIRHLMQCIHREYWMKIENQSRHQQNWSQGTIFSDPFRIFDWTIHNFKCDKVEYVTCTFAKMVFNLPASVRGLCVF